MRLIHAESLRRYLKWLDSKLDEETPLFLGGGAAMLVLVENAEATKDIDAFVDGSTGRLLALARQAPEGLALDLNTDIQAFDSYLPDDWRKKAVCSRRFSSRHLQVYTPCPEDLALMKTFRCHTKDLQDIHRLVLLDSFRPEVYRRRFMYKLPVAVGQPMVHAGSFVIVWKMIHPASRLTAEEVLNKEGMASPP